jgi:hypothetical protein
MELQDMGIHIVSRDITNMLFNGQPWLNLHQILRMVLNLVKSWRIIFKESSLESVDRLRGNV